MTCAVSQGASPLVAEPHPGTEVLYRWAKWQKQHAYPMACQAVVFRKEDSRLVVYEYGPALCVVIIRVSNGPRMRDFREWRQPLAVVQGKLKSRGWKLESQQSEVSHAH